MSELLRRAARRHDPAADRLHGEAWLAFLDAGSQRTNRKRIGNRKATGKHAEFSQGAGRLLLEGGYRAYTDAAQVDALRTVARARFLDWMGAQ